MVEQAENQYVIIGHSAAALAAVRAIRDNDTTGVITIVSAEKQMAYSPVLLTYYISNKIGRNDLFLTDNDFYERNKIHLVQGKRAVKIDSNRQTVLLEDKTSIPYDKLLIATGSSPKKLNIPGEDFPGIFTLKTITDADNILSHTDSKKDVTILGGGLVGLQSANSLAATGKNITIVIGSSQVMSQNVDQDCSEMIAEFIQHGGFKVKYNKNVTQIDSTVEKLILTFDNGETLETDTVIAGKGVAPNTQLTKGSGIAVNHGILVSDSMQTNIENIYAAGDVSEGNNLIFGMPQIIATWPNACNQGKTAGKNMAGCKGGFQGLNSNICTLLGKSIASVGITKTNMKIHSAVQHIVPEKGIYRKLVFNHNDEIVGGVFLEAVSDIGVVRHMVNNKIKVATQNRNRLVRSPISFTEFLNK